MGAVIDTLSLPVFTNMSPTELNKLKNIISRKIRHPRRTTELQNGTPLYHSPDLRSALETMGQVPVLPGQSILFWEKGINFVSHIALVLPQSSENLLLDRADLLHATPPSIGVAKGPLSSPIDESGIRICKVSDYIQADPTEYSRIIVGSPPNASDEKLTEAGMIGQEIAETGLIDGHPAVYSPPVLEAIVYIRKHDYRRHRSMFAPRLRRPADSTLTYCGRLIGSIYQQAGIKELPKAELLRIKGLGYSSSVFYEYFRDGNSLQHVVSWGTKAPSWH